MGKNAILMSRFTSFLLASLASSWLSFSACGQSATPVSGGTAPEATIPVPEANPPRPEVIINGQPLSPAFLQQYEQQYQTHIQPGRYWYDRLSGLWGVEGDWALGQILPYLDLGGPLAADASGGTSEVFFNGRRLNAKEIAYLQRFTPVYAGRYWLDAYGNVGLEGGPMLGNLVQMAQVAGVGPTTGGGQGGRSRGNGSTFYRNGYTGIGGGSDGRTHYVIGSDFSVIVGD